MIDDFANRAWAEHHKSLARNLSDIARSVGVAFDRLHAHLYDAPWRDEPRDGARCA